jgi:hypothetical protein
MTLRSPQPLTEMSIWNLPGVKGRRVRKADNLTAISEPILKKRWKPRRLTTLWVSRPVTGIALPFFFFSLRQ